MHPQTDACERPNTMNFLLQLKRLLAIALAGA